jgi:LysM repeat protein
MFRIGILRCETGSRPGFAEAAGCCRVAPVIEWGLAPLGRVQLHHKKIADALRMSCIFRGPRINGLDVIRTTFITTIFCFCVLISGCNFEHAEQKGDAEAKAGRFESAIYWYEAALGSDDREAVHWKMAEIFANKLRDPADAAYHYRRILALRPGGSRAEASRLALHRLQGSVAEASPGRPKVASTPRMSAAQEAAAEAEKEAKSKVRTYVVQTGDTLESISRKFFQTPSRWKDILDTNQNQLSSPDQLKAGQVIIIP